jgi:hypothetical protein
MCECKEGRGERREKERLAVRTGEKEEKGKIREKGPKDGLK